MKITIISAINRKMVQKVLNKKRTNAVMLKRRCKINNDVAIFKKALQ